MENLEKENRDLKESIERLNIENNGLLLHNLSLSTRVEEYVDFIKNKRCEDTGESKGSVNVGEFSRVETLNLQLNKALANLKATHATKLGLASLNRKYFLRVKELETANESLSDLVELQAEKINRLENQTENLADFIEQQIKEVKLLTPTLASTEAIIQNNNRIQSLENENENENLRKKLNSKDYAFIKWFFMFFGFLFLASVALVVFDAIYS